MKVCDKSEYHTEELIYPVGYCSTRIFGSLKDPEKQCVYTCKVMDGGQAPRYTFYLIFFNIFLLELLIEMNDIISRFEIVADTNLDVPLVSGSIDECHSMLLQLINSCLGAEVVNIKVRGADFFGLSHPTVHHLIHASPGVRKCKGYIWTKFEVMMNNQFKLSQTDHLPYFFDLEFYHTINRFINFLKLLCKSNK